VFLQQVGAIGLVTRYQSRRHNNYALLSVPTSFRRIGKRGWYRESFDPSLTGMGFFVAKIVRDYRHYRFQKK